MRCDDCHIYSTWHRYASLVSSTASRSLPVPWSTIILAIAVNINFSRRRSAVTAAVHAAAPDVLARSICGLRSNSFPGVFRAFSQKSSDNILLSKRFRIIIVHHVINYCVIHSPSRDCFYFKFLVFSVIISYKELIKKISIRTDHRQLAYCSHYTIYTRLKVDILIIRL